MRITTHPVTVPRKAPAVLLAALIAGFAAVPSQAQKFRVLDFQGVGGFEHDSREVAGLLMDSLAKLGDYMVDHAKEATVFTAANMAKYQVLVFNNSTKAGDIFNVDQKKVVLDFMKTKGFLGFHGAGDTKGTWPEYSTFLGGELSSHGGGDAEVNINPDPLLKTHPVTEGSPAQYVLSEEWYSYRTNPRLAPGVHVLFDINEDKCPRCNKMGDHPIVWVKGDPAGGRTFYMAMGHGKHQFQRIVTNKVLIKQALLWAAKELPLGLPTATGVGDARVTGAAPRYEMKLQTGQASLTVETGREGPHAITLSTLDGKIVGRRSGSDARAYTFDGLRSGSLYTLMTTTSLGSHSRMVAIP